MDKQIIESKLNRIVDTLNKSIDESLLAIGDPEKGYPYATGYSRSAMQQVLTEVEEILKEWLPKVY